MYIHTSLYRDRYKVNTVIWNKLPSKFAATNLDAHFFWKATLIKFLQTSKLWLQLGVLDSYHRYDFTQFRKKTWL